MTKLWTTCIYEWIVRRKAAQELGEEYNEEVESERKAKKPRSSSSHIAVSDVPSVSTLFTILALCWDGILNDLEEKENEPLRTVRQDPPFNNGFSTFGKSSMSLLFSLSTMISS